MQQNPESDRSFLVMLRLKYCLIRKKVICDPQTKCALPSLLAAQSCIFATLSVKEGFVGMLKF